MYEGNFYTGANENYLIEKLLNPSVKRITSPKEVNTQYPAKRFKEVYIKYTSYPDY